MAQEAITRTQFQEKLNLLLAKDDRDCERLVNVYDNVKACTEKSALVKGLVLQHDPDLFKHVEQGVTDLKKPDRPILVIGESSAGKSSFLNLLIGRKVLPELARPCTHCMCSIKNGPELEAHVSSFDGSTSSEPQIISADGLSDEVFQDKVQELVNKDNCEKAPDRCIEIFVPSTLLEDNIYLVDTPGFGENPQVTKSLVKYLPKAIGIIFILNTTVSIGIADDRGVLIIDEIKRLREEGKIPSFDPTKVLFIGNKWDQIPEKERKVHRSEIIGKMKTVWPDFQEEQLLPLSVQYVSRLQNTNSISEDYKSATEDYQTVLNKIHETVEHCGNARSQVHSRFLSKVLKHMKTFVDATVAQTSLSAEQKITKVKTIKGLINDMESTYEKERKEIGELAGVIENQIAEDFHQYLTNSENREHIFPWTECNIPQGGQYGYIRYKARVLIRCFIVNAFTTRITMSQQAIQDLADRMNNLKIYKIQETIENLLQRETNDITSSPGPDEMFWKDSEEVYWRYIGAFVFVLPIWAPLRVAGLFTYGIYKAYGKYQLNKYRGNPKVYLDRLAGEVISEDFSKESLKKILYEKLTMNCVEKEMDRIKKSIDDLKNLCNRVMDTDELPEGFDEIRDLCHRMKEKLDTTEQS